MTLQEMKLHWDVVNPISGCTLKEELENQQAWGGRLPYETILSLIRRGIRPPLVPYLYKKISPMSSQSARAERKNI